MRPASIQMKGADGAWLDLGHLADDIILGLDGGSDTDEALPAFTTSRGLTYSMDLTLAEVDCEAISLLVGEHPGKPRPTTAHSLVIERTERVSGEPRKPLRNRGVRDWWRWRKAMKVWRIAHADWVAAGRPDVDQKIRTYFPRVELT